MEGFEFWREERLAWSWVVAFFVGRWEMTSPGKKPGWYPSQMDFGRCKNHLGKWEIFFGRCKHYFGKWEILFGKVGQVLSLSKHLKGCWGTRDGDIFSEFICRQENCFCRCKNNFGKWEIYFVRCKNYFRKWENYLGRWKNCLVQKHHQCRVPKDLLDV